MPLPAAVMLAAPLLGKLFGGAAKGSADQRLNENQQRLQQAQMMNNDALQRQSLNLSGANLDLNRKQFAQNEPSVQARQAMLGSLLERLQPVSLSGVSERVRIPQMQNSLLSALGPEARQAGALLAQRGVTGLQNPTQFDALPSMPPAMQAALKESGLLEKLLGAGGLIGSTVGAIGDLGTFNRRGEQPPMGAG